MRIFIPSKLLILLAFMTGAFIMAACSPSAEKSIKQGNEAFAKEEYLVALHEYQSAQVESPELAEPYYNAANALYREGAYTEALEQMQLALQNIDNETLAENSIYNLGNTFYKTQELEQAIESYTSALLLDPYDQDAKYNLELALQQQQQQEQQQAQEQQQEQENQDQEQVQSESSEQQDEEQQSEENQSQNSGNQDQEQQGQDQENKSEQGSDEQRPENEDPQKEEQQNQGQNNDSGQPQESQEQSDQQGQPGELPADQRMTEEQARQLLEALAQDMDTLQERLGQILRVQIPPPVQDW